MGRSDRLVLVRRLEWNYLRKCGRVDQVVSRSVVCECLTAPPGLVKELATVRQSLKIRPRGKCYFTGTGDTIYMAYIAEIKVILKS